MLNGPLTTLRLPGPFARRRGRGFNPASLFANGEQGDDFWFWRDFCFTLSSGGVYEPVTTTGDQIARMTGTVNGINADQDVAEARPVYGESGSIGWAELDGVDDVMLLPSDIQTSNGPVTLAAGSELYADNGTASIFDTDNGRIIFAARSDNAGRFGVSDGLAWTQHTPDNLFDKRVMTAVLRGDNSVLRSNGENRNTFSSALRAVSGNTAIGARNDGTGLYMEGRIFSFILRAHDTNNTDIDQIEKLLAQRSGVTL